LAESDREPRGTRWEVGAVSQSAIGGGVGTLFMSGFMLACGALGLMGEQPPKKVTRRAFAAIVGNSPSERTSNVLASFAHVAFGMGAGALFGLFPWRGQARSLSALQGILFGVGVWAASYRGWIPMLGILPPPEHDRPGRPVAMIAAHIIWGAALGTVAHKRAAERTFCPQD
jgi:hypothetical protein